MNSNLILITGDFAIIKDDAIVHNEFKNGEVWKKLRTFYSDDSKIITNLECPFTMSSDEKKYKWANLKCNPINHHILDGIDMAVLGNNHIGDFGYAGALETIELLESKNINHVGYGKDLNEALSYSTLNIQGKKIGLISLNCITTNSESIATYNNAGVAPISFNIIESAIKSAKNSCDALVIYFHWGNEWVHEPVPDQISLAHYAIDCGADLIVGCHSHTIQSFEKYKNKWIFYGLGNFLFWGGQSQIFNDDGTITYMPLRNEKPNRQSMVIAFKISINKNNPIDLVSVRYFEFNHHNLNLAEINPNDLTFNIIKFNKRLSLYSKIFKRELKSSKDVVYNNIVRNGIPAFFYQNRSLDIPTYKIALYYLSRLKYKTILSFQNWFDKKKTKFNSFLLALRIKFKWLMDKFFLPLRKEHKVLYNIIHNFYFSEFNKLPNLVHCQDFNEKIQWLKLFDQSDDVVMCSDKILVREFIKRRIGDNYLVKLYGTYDSLDEIDFDSLPKSFVIKTNHDSGTVILVKDKYKLDFNSIKLKLNYSLNRIYGWDKGEWAYSLVNPKILIEEYLLPFNDAPPPDYKFQCTNGQVEFCRYTYDRGVDTKEIVLDNQGNNLGFIIDENFKQGDQFVLNERWNDMLIVASKLSSGFKCVRVDMYVVDNQIFIGELTFYPMSGVYKGIGQKLVGNKYLNFDRNTFKPCIYQKSKMY
jgi:hypothetical protein